MQLFDGWYCPDCVHVLTDSYSKKVSAHLKEQDKIDVAKEQERIEEESRLNKLKEEKKSAFEIALVESSKREEERKEKEKDDKLKKEEERQKKLKLIIENRIDCFYYLTSRSHLLSILKRGILPRNKAEYYKLITTDLSSDSVQENREIKKVPISNGHLVNLHDLVPLYFVYKTPNNYRMWKKNKEIVLICIKKNILNYSECAFAFSDGNMANNKTRTFTRLVHLDKLDWEIVNNSFADFKDSEIKRKRMSEMLIYPNVSINFFEKIIVPTDEIKSNVQNSLNILGFEIPILVDNSYFG